MKEIERAILAAVGYAASFEQPLTLPELQRRLGQPADAAALAAHLQSPAVSRRVAQTGAWVHPHGCAHWIERASVRAARARELLDRHQALLQRLAALPYVRLVALSGGCAYGDGDGGDVDVFVVARRGRAWLVTLAAVVLAKAAGLRRTFCLNYVVDEAGASLPERDAFTAGEIAGLRPLYGAEGYRRFVAANAWVRLFVPNFFASHLQDAERLPEAGSARWLERMLDAAGAPLLERLACWLYGAHLRRTCRGPGVHLGPHRLKLHAHDHAPRLGALLRRLEAEPGQAWPEREAS